MKQYTLNLNVTRNDYETEYYTSIIIDAKHQYSSPKY